MPKKQLIKIGLKDGSYLSCVKDYNYFERAVMIESMEKAKDDDMVIFENGIGVYLLIPKKNILFIEIIPEKTDKGKEGGEINGEIYRNNKVRSGED